MRRESSTVIAIVGEVTDALLAGLARSPNVSVVRLPDSPTDRAQTEQANTRQATARPVTASPAAAEQTAADGAQPGWEPGAQAMREAAHRRSTYVVVAHDPLAGVAAGWRAMWDLTAGSQGAAEFEGSAADALAAWRGKRFELPDYYLVMAPAQAVGTGPDLYLGPLRAIRPRRVAIAGIAASPAQTSLVLDSVRSLEHGPWWPPLEELLDAARHFYAGGLTETQQSAPDN